MSSTTGAETLPFSCACAGSGWIQIGQEAIFTDLGDGYGPRLVGWEPVEERCPCSMPTLEQLDEETDEEGGF